mmetsp:Transcript_27930/g.72276  ORF Transcript_27930/g.72276 Transcript_27930/m.72276 type:complete len:242 (-) Transcript_27930:87-812(-)
MWHTFSFSFGVYVLVQQSWWRGVIVERKPELLYVDWQTHEFDAWMRLYYQVELAFWITCLVYHGFQSIQKDFLEMLLHHLVTIYLILVSGIVGFTRCGICVLVFHDIADVFLYSAKAADKAGVKPRVVVDVLFGLFVVAFFVGRMIMYPGYVVVPAYIYAVSQEYWFAMPQFKDVKYSMKLGDPGTLCLPIAMTILLGVHCYWWALICKMIWKTVQNGSVTEEGDIRSDDESEEVEPKKSK